MTANGTTTTTTRSAGGGAAANEPQATTFNRGCRLCLEEMQHCAVKSAEKSEARDDREKVAVITVVEGDYEEGDFEYDDDEDEDEDDDDDERNETETSPLNHATLTEACPGSLQLLVDDSPAHLRQGDDGDHERDDDKHSHIRVSSPLRQPQEICTLDSLFFSAAPQRRRRPFSSENPAFSLDRRSSLPPPPQPSRGCKGQRRRRRRRRPQPRPVGPFPASQRGQEVSGQQKTCSSSSRGPRTCAFSPQTSARSPWCSR